MLYIIFFVSNHNANARIRSYKRGLYRSFLFRFAMFNMQREKRGDRWLMDVKRSSNGKRVGIVCVFGCVTDTQNEQDSMST